MSGKRAKAVRLDRRKRMALSLRGFLEQIPDPRARRGVRYSLADMLTMMVIGMLWGARSATKIHDVLVYHKRKLSGLAGITRIPSHDRFSAIMRQLDHNLLADALVRWVQTILEDFECGLVCLDGKTTRAAGERRKNGKSTLNRYVLNAYDTKSGLAIGQLKVNAKSNERTHYVPLLKLLDVAGALICADAAATTRKVAAEIIAMGADYLLPVKDDQKSLKEEIADHVDFLMAEGKGEVFDTGCEKAHGRLERRIVYCAVIKGTDLTPEGWDSVATVISVRRVTEEMTTGNASDTTTFYISSVEMPSAEKVCTLVRSYWGVENRLQYRLDGVEILEDRHNARKGHALENWAALRKFIFNLCVLETLEKGPSPSGGPRCPGDWFSANGRRTKSLIFGPTPHLVANC